MLDTLVGFITVSGCGVLGFVMLGGGGAFGTIGAHVAGRHRRIR